MNVMTEHPSTTPPPESPTPDRASPHSLRNRLARFVWGIVYLVLFRPSPRNLHRWRNWLLRAFGAKLHPNARVYPRATIWLPSNLIMHENACISDDVVCYCADRVEIGAHSIISQFTYLCGATHEFEKVNNPLVAKPIIIGRRCWVAASCFVGPGVTIGDGAIVGATSSVYKDLKGWTVYVGNPARALRPRTLTPADFGEALATTNRDSQQSHRERGEGTEGIE